MFAVLHDHALALLSVLLHAQCHSRRLGKGLVDTPIPHRRALQVPQRAYASGHLEALVVVDCRSLLAGLARLVLIVLALLSEIALERHQDQLHVGAVVGDFADPFGFDVFERVFAVDRVAEHDQVGVVCWGCVSSDDGAKAGIGANYRRRGIVIDRILLDRLCPRGRVRYVHYRQRYLARELDEIARLNRARAYRGRSSRRRWARRQLGSS